MKKIIILFMAVIMLATTGISCLADDELTLISIDKTVTSSGSTFGWMADKIADGNINSTWSSNSGDIWAIIDLGATYNISRIDVYPRMDMDQAESRGNFTVEVSNDIEFSTEVENIMTVGNQEHLEIKRAIVNLDEEYRYVRIHKNSGYLCVGEVMVFSDPTKRVEKISTINVTDVYGENLNKLKLITALGCLKFELVDEKFEPDKTLTRGEFTSMLMNAMISDIQEYSKDEFTDISGHFAKNEINAAVKMGYIKGGDKFYPDKEISQIDILKFAVRALNCDALANVKGGNLSVYTDIARSKKLLDSVKFTGGGITRENAVSFIYNILFAYPDIHDEITDNGTVTYRKSENCILWSVHKIDYTEGVVTANEVTDLNFNSLTSEKFIRIKNTDYKIARGIEVGSEVLGQNVRAYFNENNEIICINPKDEQEIITLSSDEIKSFSSYKYTYLKNNKNKVATLSQTCDIVYNGTAIGGLTNSQFVPLNGKVILIDQNGDEKYDVVKIYAYKNNKILNVSVHNESISLCYGTEKYISLKDKEYTIVKNGKKVGISALKSNDIISFTQNMEETYFEVYVTSSRIYGKVEAFNDDRIFLENDENEYIRSSNFLNSSQMELGLSGHIYLDALGKVAYFEYDKESGIRYAFVSKMVRLKSGLEDEIQVELFNTTGSGVYVINEKTKICGKKYPTVDELEIALKAQFYDEKGTFKAQIVKYCSDYNLNIKELYTTDGSDEYTGNTDKTIKLLGGAPETAQSAWYINEILGGKYITDSNTVIFDIKKDNNEYECTIRPVSYFTTLSSRNVSFNAVYGVDEFKPAEVILKMSSGELSSGKRSYVMIERVNPVIDEKGESQYKIKGYSKGTKVEYLTTNEKLVKNLNLKAGMVIGINDFDGKISALNIIYNPETDMANGVTLIENNDLLFNDAYTYVLKAKVKKVSDGIIVFENDGGTYVFREKSMPKISLYDKSEGEISIIECRDLKSFEEMPEEYNTVFAHVKNGNILDIYAY